MVPVGTIHVGIFSTSVAFGRGVAHPGLGARTETYVTLRANGPARHFASTLGCPGVFRITGPVVGLQVDVTGGIAWPGGTVAIAGPFAHKVVVQRS
jgi:hypothetical protein